METSWVALQSSFLDTRNGVIAAYGFICSVPTPPDTTCGAAALQQMRASFCGVGAWTLYRPCITVIMPRPEYGTLLEPGMF